MVQYKLSYKQYSTLAARYSISSYTSFDTFLKEGYNVIQRNTGGVFYFASEEHLTWFLLKI